MRYVFVQQNSKVTLNEIPQGTYKIRFCFGDDWDSGLNYFTNIYSFFEFGNKLTFDETREDDGVEYTRQEITLHTVPNGMFLERRSKKLYSIPKGSHTELAEQTLKWLSGRVAHLDQTQNRVAHLRDGFIVSKVSIRAMREPSPRTPLISYKAPEPHACHPENPSHSGLPTRAPPPQQSPE